MPRRRASYSLAHPGREDAELVAILGDGAARDLDATLLQDVHDCLIGERVLGIFIGNELLDLRLDAARRDVLAAGGRESGREEEGERLEILHALLEEVALPVDDEVHHLEHRLPALLDRLNHPVRRVHLVGDELLVLAVELLLVARDLDVRSAQLESRDVRIVERDEIDAVDLVDDEIGDDVVVAGFAVDEPRLRIELRDLVGGVLHVGDADAEALGDLAATVIDQLIEAVADEAIRHRLLETRLAELQEQALAQIARADARRIERLNRAQHGLALVLGVERKSFGVAPELFRRLLDPLVDAATNLVERARKVAVFIDVADELLGELMLALVEIEERNLIAKMIAEIAAIDGDRLEV